jgi:AcrR family transcriptional regulator
MEAAAPDEQPGTQPRSGRRSYTRRFAPPVRRQLVLSVARDLILEKGLAATSLRDIARAAGVSTGTLTYHFGSLDELLLAVFREASKKQLDALYADLEADGTPMERLARLIDRFLAPATMDSIKLWVDYSARAAHVPALYAWHSGEYAEWRLAIERLIKLGIESGDFAPVDPRDVAIGLVALMDGFSIRLTSGPERLERDAIRRVLETYLGDRLRSRPRAAPEKASRP